ncbi:MAG: hypothetical protein K2W99_02630 [Chthoniobacterales bacterium]|nr:hypothetical protein [Chthoniobacterales bacterium]
MKTKNSSFSLLTFSLILFGFFAPSSFGTIYRLDDDIKPDAEGVYDVPVNAEVLVELVGHVGGPSAVNPIIIWAATSGFDLIERSLSDLESVTESAEFVQTGEADVHYDFLLKTTNVDKDNPIRKICFFNSAPPFQSISKKIRVLDSGALHNFQELQQSLQSVDSSDPTHHLIGLSKSFVKNLPPPQMSEYENVANGDSLEVNCPKNLWSDF